jgi:hypothetical protein
VLGAASGALLLVLPLVFGDSGCALIDSFQGFTGAMPDSHYDADTDATAPPLDGSHESGDAPSDHRDGSSEADVSADACPTGTGSAVCGGSCVDTTTDDANCGSCGSTCGAPSYCSGGQCLFKCSNGTNFTVSIVSTAVADGTYQVQSASGLALDDPNGGAAGTGLDQFAYLGTNQEWTVTGAGGGMYKIVAQNGLAVTGQGMKTQVTLEPYTGSSQQLFVFVHTGSTWHIVDIVDCTALDDSGGGINHVVAEGTFAPALQTQSWTLTPVANVTAPMANGTYEITDTSSGYVMDDKSGGGSGTIPDLAAYTGANQRWTVTLVSGVEYKVVAASGAALTMSATPNATIAALSSYTGASDQLWVFWPSGNGLAYGIINVGIGMALDDHAGGGLGVQLQQWTWANNGHQQWTVTPAP